MSNEMTNCILQIKSNFKLKDRSKLFICVIHYKKMPILITFLVFTFVTTFGEYILVCLEKIVYRNEWNIIWTGVSYLFTYSIYYVYYKLVRKFILLN